MKNSNEKSFDDLVYEDEFYAEENKKRELADPDEKEAEEENQDLLLEVILVCEDCENRWEDLISSDSDSVEIFCPLCGSNKVIQL